MIEVLFRVPLPIGLASCLLLPAWWLAGRLLASSSSVLYRATFAVGLSLAGYLTFVNLLGRQLERSLVPVALYVAINVALSVFILRRRRSEVSLAACPRPPRAHYLVLALTLLLAVPQALVAVSGWLWDESGSSHIHLTAANQFADDVFPPRHNAFPDIPIKYHYATTLLVGTLRWLTGFPATPCLDFVNTSLWIVIFLFVFSWLEGLGLRRFAAFWGSFATLLGGGLAWIYLPRIETYGGFRKIPFARELIHSYDPEQSWLRNLLTVLENQNYHLKNADGSFSYIFLDIANFFQQHPVPIGILLTLTALSLFSVWLGRRGFSLSLLFANIFCFGLVFLGHSVYGAMVCVTAGLVLGMRWIRTKTWADFHTGILFTAGVTAVAFLHGGMLSTGPLYGASALARTREQFGFWLGGLRGFVDGSLASFGLPMLLAVVAVATWWWRQEKTEQQGRALLLFGLFGGISFAAPQFIFYAAAESHLEQFTEIAKFFFCSHLGFAVLSAFGVDFLQRRLRVPALALIPGLAMMAVMPFAFSYSNSFTDSGEFKGIRISRFAGERLELARRFDELKTGNRDCFYDASRFEITSGYLSELLLEGGSVFTLTPVKYEVNGAGYRLSGEAVAERLKWNSRMARLLPGAAENSECQWFYTRGLADFARLPALVRSRFEHAVAEGHLGLEDEGAGYKLYRIKWPTGDWDEGLERSWRPSVISQVHTDWDGDGSEDLIFFDYSQHQIIVEGESKPLPSRSAGSEFPVLLVGNFPGDDRVDLMFGRMADTYHDFGSRIEELNQYNAFHWSYYDSTTASWGQEYRRWYWLSDLPFVADVDNNGLDEHLAYRVSNSTWFLAADRTLAGPSMPPEDLPVPFAGRFFAGSSGDLGLWSLRSGELILQSIDGVHTSTFKWAGRREDVLVPADYDGDGLDEVGVWQRYNQTWFIRTMPNESIRSARFGSETGVPLPADYDGDGRVDLAYWEPTAQTIYVSLDFGASVDREIRVPPNAIPIFVNMY